MGWQLGAPTRAARPVGILSRELFDKYTQNYYLFLPAWTMQFYTHTEYWRTIYALTVHEEREGEGFSNPWTWWGRVGGERKE